MIARFGTIGPDRGEPVVRVFAGHCTTVDDVLERRNPVDPTALELALAT